MCYLRCSTNALNEMWPSSAYVFVSGRLIFLHARLWFFIFIFVVLTTFNVDLLASFAKIIDYALPLRKPGASTIISFFI